VTKLPKDAPTAKVIRALEALGLGIIREGNHISMCRINLDGSKMPLTLPNHREIKSSTLKLILRPAGITREEFLKAINEL
jgi:hypothetical protein